MAIGLSKNREFQQISFVNSIATTEFGEHLTVVTRTIVNLLLDKVPKADILGELGVQNHLFIFVNCLIDGATFESDGSVNFPLRNFTEQFIPNKNSLIDRMKNAGIVRAIENSAKEQGNIESKNRRRQRTYRAKKRKAELGETMKQSSKIPIKRPKPNEDIVTLSEMPKKELDRMYQRSKRSIRRARVKKAMREAPKPKKKRKRGNRGKIKRIRDSLIKVTSSLSLSLFSSSTQCIFFIFHSIPEMNNGHSWRSAFIILKREIKSKKQQKFEISNINFSNQKYIGYYLI